MVKIKIRIIPLFIILLSIFLSACTAAQNNDIDKSSDSTDVPSYMRRLDAAMEHAENPKPLAQVDGTVITQVDLDLFSTDDPKCSVDDVVWYNITTMTAEKNGLMMDDRDQELYDNTKLRLESDTQLSDAYCLENYGIPKSEVVQYYLKRIYQIGMNSVFVENLIDDISSGAIVTKYPDLADEYAIFEKERQNDPYHAWMKFEKLCNERVAEDYDIVIY